MLDLDAVTVERAADELAVDDDRLALLEDPAGLALVATGIVAPAKEIVNVVMPSAVSTEPWSTVPWTRRRRPGSQPSRWPISSTLQ